LCAPKVYIKCLLVLAEHYNLCEIVKMTEIRAYIHLAHYHSTTWSRSKSCLVCCSVVGLRHLPIMGNVCNVCYSVFSQQKCSALHYVFYTYYCITSNNKPHQEAMLKRCICLPVNIAHDIRLVHCVMCLFTPQILKLPTFTTWWQRYTGVNNLCKVIT